MGAVLADRHREKNKKVLDEVSNIIKKEYVDQRRGDLKRINSIDALCVGAGISADVNVGVNGHTYLWNGLVYGIAGELLQDEVRLLDSSPNKKYQDNIIKGIEKLVREERFLESDNTMECVEYLKNWAFPNHRVNTEERLAENVLSLITHKLFNKPRQDGDDKARIEIQKEYDEAYDSSNNYIKGKGHTLVEVAMLIKRMKDDVSKHNRSVNVISYNYDDYLETALDNFFYNMKICSIYDVETQKKALNSEVNIYHVHGYIPLNWDQSRMCGEFIFSESSYSNISNEIYHWTNRVQAEQFIRQRILFVGFSGVDTNFRRLMKEIKKEQERTLGSILYHKMFMCYKNIVDGICNDLFWDEIQKSVSGETIDEDVAVKIAVAMIMSIIDAKDSYYKDQLGIELIWYNKIVEIPDILSETYVSKK